MEIIWTKSAKQDLINYQRNSRIIKVENINLYIASLIESDRGVQRSLKETYYGNVEKEFQPNKAFQEEMKCHHDH